MSSADRTYTPHTRCARSATHMRRTDKSSASGKRTANTALFQTSVRKSKWSAIQVRTRTSHKRSVEWWPCSIGGRVKRNAFGCCQLVLYEKNAPGQFCLLALGFFPHRLDISGTRRIGATGENGNAGTVASEACRRRAPFDFKSDVTCYP